jgi:Concanavalin A-like lectin/glucanases superfamily/Putative Ig domain/Bacterial Ig-like domain (group 2)/PQQ-like domain
MKRRSVSGHRRIFVTKSSSRISESGLSRYLLVTGRVWGAPFLALLIGAVIFSDVLAGHAGARCLGRCETTDAPVLTNPGSQSSPVTEQYGYAGGVTAAQPVGYWRFDDYAGTTATDWAATPHAGTIAGGVTLAQPGALADGSLAMHFDGQPGSHVEIAGTTALDLPNTVTLEAWVNIADGASSGTVFERLTDDGVAYRLVHGGGYWIFRVQGSSLGQQAVIAVTAGDVGAWIHLVCTFDGTTTRIYKNGVEGYSPSGGGTMWTGGGVARIGEAGAGGATFNGLIDEIAVYDRVLTPNQITGHYLLRNTTSSVAVQMIASDPESEALTYSATGLPPGLLINPGTGLVSGNPTQTGTFTVAVTATDPGGLAASETFTWTITSSPVANPHQPSVTNPGSQSSPVTGSYGYAGGVTAAQPVGFWRLDDYVGTTAVDWAATPHAGTVSGGVARGQAGALADGSLAMHFDGQPGSHVEIPGTPALDLPNSVTLEAWVNIADGAASGTVFERLTDNGAAYRLVQGGWYWIFRVQGSGLGQQAVIPVTAGDVGAWIHLVATFDGTTTRIYKNGVEGYSPSGGGTMWTGGGVARIGEAGAGGATFNGAIDEVAVYDAVLTPEQITSHYGLRAALSSVSLQIAATDPEGEPLEYGATGLPAGLLMNPNTGLVTGNPTTVGTFTATATATDPGGLAASQTFAWTIGGAAPPSCTYAASPTSLTIPAAGQAGTIAVTTDATCTWSSTAGAWWASSSPTTGQASGLVTYQIAENTATAQRTTTLSVAGKVIPVTQEAAAPRSGPVSIVAMLSASADAAGWHKSAVTVTFRCQNANDCTAPITMAADGAAQLVTGTASNSDHSATTSVTLNIDRTPATLAFVNPLPAETDDPSVVVNASGIDSLSGLTGAKCNGADASIGGSAVSCTVTLVPGRNIVIVQASDAAGNTTSVSRVVQFGTAAGSPPTTLSITPTRVVLPTGGRRLVGVTDNFGRAIDSPAWTTSEAGIATVTAEGLVTGVSAGTATIIAALGGLSAELQVTVLAGGTLPLGTEQWSVSATPGYYVAQTIKGMPGMNGTTYLLERELNGGGSSLVRVLDDDGNEQWSASVPIVAGDEPIIAMGDSLGGVLLNVRHWVSGGVSSMIRIGPDGVGSWHRASTTAQAQAGDGTIYATELSDWVVVLDGETGAERARVALGRSSNTYLHSFDAPTYESYSTSGGTIGKLIVDASGNARFTLATGDSFQQQLPTQIRRLASKFELWTVTPSGAVSIATLATDVVPDGDPRRVKKYYRIPQLIIPDDSDTALVMWYDEWAEPTNGGANLQYHFGGHFARVPAGAGSPSMMAPADEFGFGQGAMGEQNTLFVSSGYGDVAALDATTGAMKWSLEFAGEIVATIAGGGVVVRSTETRATYDGNGTLLSLITAAPDTTLGDVTGLVNEGTSISARAVASDQIQYASVGWRVPTGSLLGGASPTSCRPPIFPDYVAKPPLLLTYLFSDAGGPITPAQTTIISGAAQLWEHAGFPSLHGPYAENQIQVRWFDLRPTGDYAGYVAWPKLRFPKYYSNPTELIVRSGLPFSSDQFGMALDTTTFLNQSSAASDLFLKEMALHEFGHLIGLAHPQDSCNRAETIMARKPDQNRRTTLSALDKLALTRLLAGLW